MAKSRNTSYLDRTPLQRVRANLKKARGLLERKEYSSSVMRSVIAVEVFVSGLVLTKLRSKIPGPLPERLVRKTSLEEKLTWCFESLFGFSASRRYRNTFPRLMVQVRLRNRIAHQGVFAKRVDAVEAYTTATSLIKKMAKRLRIKTTELDALFSSAGPK